MKTLRLALPLAVLAFCAPASTVFAQDASTSRDTLLGAIAGAIIGHQNGRTAEGALIGAGAGLVVNALSHNQGNDNGHMTGALLGGAAGAMIGKHNGNTAAGALVGATVGYIASDARPVTYNASYSYGYPRDRDCYEAPRRQVIVVQPRCVEPQTVVYSAPACAEPDTVTYVTPGYEAPARVVVVNEPEQVIVVRQRPAVIVRDRGYVVVRRRDRDRWHDRDDRRDRD